MARRQIVPGTFRHRLAQWVLTRLYGASPDKDRGWHFYPVYQASTGAHVVCAYKDGGVWKVGIVERGGPVEGAGLLSATFGGFVDVPRREQPLTGVCREKGEESGERLKLSPERLRLVDGSINYGEVKHWHADHATATYSYMVVLTASEYALLKDGLVSAEVAGLRFVPITDVPQLESRFAYPHEFQALLKVCAILANS